MSTTSNGQRSAKTLNTTMHTNNTMKSSKLTKEHQALYDAWYTRSYSWSQHSSYAYSQEQWFDSYILNIRGSSPQMEFGNVVGGKLASEPTYLPAIPRQTHMEYEVRTKLGKLELVGFFDSYHPKKRIMEEYKTSSNENKWNKDSVEEHGQLTYYCMLLMLKEKVPPESVQITLHYIPVSMDSFFEMSVSGPVQHFPTKRTTKQVFSLMVEIKKRRKEMEKYAMKRLLEIQHAS